MEFKSRPKGKRRPGVSIVKIKGSKGYYLRWYEKRENIVLMTITADFPHNLKLQPAKHGGLVVMENPQENSQYKLEAGDIINKIAGFTLKNLSDFESTLKAFNGKQIRIKINRGGKTGTTPRFVKAGDNKEQAKKSLGNWKEIKERKEKNLVEKIQFSRLCDEFLNWARTPVLSRYSKSWIKRVEGIIKSHKKRWGALPIDTITTKDIEEWISKRSKERAISTVNNEVAPLRIMFKLAVKWDYIKENPLRIITLKKPPESEPKYLNKNELDLLLNIANQYDENRLIPRYTKNGGAPISVAGQSIDAIKKTYNKYTNSFDYARLKFLSLTALRKSQLVDLTWNQYVSKSGVITFQTTAEHSEKSRRVLKIPLPKEAKKILEGQSRNSKYIFPNLQNNQDKQISRRLERGIFKKFEDQTDRHLSLHMLRHTALTHLLKHTKNIELVSKFAGHKKIETTQIYARILQEEMSAAVNDFDI